MQRLRLVGLVAIATFVLSGRSFGQPKPEPPPSTTTPDQLVESSSVIGSTAAAGGNAPGMTGTPGAPLGYPYGPGSSAGAAAGGVEAGAVEVGSTASAADSSVATGNTLVETISREPIDFDFTNTDILTILRTVAVKFNKNIIAAPDVGGKVTLHIHGVPFDEAFRTLLDQLGLVAIQKSSKVIKIIKAVEMPYLVQVFKLRYRFALELQTTLNNMLKGKEREATVISVDLASNSLIVTSANDVLQKIKSMVDQLDIASPQITIKARLIEISADSDLKWGVAWANVTKFGEGGKIQGIKDPVNFSPPDANGNPVTQNVLTGFPLGGVLAVSSVLDKTQLYGIINALKSDTRNKTISEPMIMTGNNKSAKIHVGQNLPVVTSQVTLTATTQGVQYIPEGVDLDVTPIVSPGSDTISFKIRVTVSELVGFQNNNPITTERTAQTEVSIESGKTVVIGGLMKDTVSDSNNGIPFLKDIPILGYLFKTRHKTKNKTELLIFITPELLAKPR